MKLNITEIKSGFYRVEFLKNGQLVWAYETYASNLLNSIRESSEVIRGVPLINI